MISSSSRSGGGRAEEAEEEEKEEEEVAAVAAAAFCLAAEKSDGSCMVKEAFLQAFPLPNLSVGITEIQAAVVVRADVLVVECRIRRYVVGPACASPPANTKGHHHRMDMPVSMYVSLMQRECVIIDALRRWH